MMTQAFSLSETALTLALLSLVFWLAPSGRAPDMLEVLSASCRAFCRWPCRSPTRSR